MSKILSVLGFVVGLIVILFLLWGGTELIATLFNVEESGKKTLIRWGLIVGLLVFGSVMRRKFPSLR